MADPVRAVEVCGAAPRGARFASPPGFAIIPKMPQRTSGAADEPHDVLAAEEFVVPAPDPKLQTDPAHDVLAAEGFAVPYADPELHAGRRRPLTLPPDPEDPTNAGPAHDVLAAEEFAVPAPEPHAVPPGYIPPPEPPSWRGRIYAAVTIVTAGLALRRWRRRRRATRV